MFESHANFLVAAENLEEARITAKGLPEFTAYGMHVDGIQEIQAIAGHRVALLEDKELNGRTLISSHRHRDLAQRR